MQADKALRALNVLVSHYGRIKIEPGVSGGVVCVCENSSCLPEVYGFGHTVEEAMQNVIEKIANKIELMGGILDGINA